MFYNRSPSIQEHKQEGVGKTGTYIQAYTLLGITLCPLKEKEYTFFLFLYGCFVVVAHYLFWTVYLASNPLPFYCSLSLILFSRLKWFI